MGRIFRITIAAMALLAVGFSAQAIARERISCTVRAGCQRGKDARRPIDGMSCMSRHYHLRHYYFCVPA